MQLFVFAFQPHNSQKIIKKSKKGLELRFFSVFIPNIFESRNLMPNIMLKYTGVLT